MTVVDPLPLLAALNKAEVPYVVIGGFAVIANGYVRATEDLDVLVPAQPSVAGRVRTALGLLGATERDGSEIAAVKFDGEHHIRAMTAHGILDVIPEGESPLTYAEIAAGAFEGRIEGHHALVAGLAHIVALKRLADRPRDRVDIESLETAHGRLPELD